MKQLIGELGQQNTNYIKSLDTRLLPFWWNLCLIRVVGEEKKMSLCHKIQVGIISVQGPIPLSPTLVVLYSATLLCISHAVNNEFRWQIQYNTNKMRSCNNTFMGGKMKLSLYWHNINKVYYHRHLW